MGGAKTEQQPTTRTVYFDPGEPLPPNGIPAKLPGMMQQTDHPVAIAPAEPGTHVVPTVIREKELPQPGPDLPRPVQPVSPATPRKIRRY